MILRNNDRPIPKFRATVCSSLEDNLLVIEARAIALSADNVSSSDINTGNKGASSTHLSISSRSGVSEVRDAESIRTCQFKYS